MTDLTIDVNDNSKLTCRVVFLATRNDKILCMKGKHFSFLPGGRIQFNEPSNEAAGREVKEELGIDIETPQLCGVMENFFYEQHEQYNGHEYCFFYRINLTDDFVPPEFEPCGRRNEWEWIGIDDWNNHCLPKRHHQDLEKLFYSDTFFHIINRD